MNDPYMTMQREAAVAFDNVTRETPGLPDWTGPERASLLRHAGFIAELAARLKTAARNARENGNEMLAVWLIRFQLSVEETGELAEAVAEGDLPHALNELTDLAYVTDGHLEGSVHFTAGIALCQAAGCVVTDLNGDPIHTGRGMKPAADAATHQQQLDMVRPHQEAAEGP